MRLRLRSPRQLAKTLLDLARSEPEEVADYLEANPEEWEALAEAAPSDAADVLEQLDDEDAAGLLAGLDASEAAEVLEEIAPELAAELVEDLPVTKLAEALSEMQGDLAADLLGELDEEVVEDILAAMTDEAEEEVRGLLAFPTDSAGGLMTTDIAALPESLSAGEAIERIRQLMNLFEDLSYVYVVDDESRLKGVISFRHLVYSRPGAPLSEVMVPDPITVGPYSDRQEVIDICQSYHFFGVPVVDERGVLLGVVTRAAVIEAAQDEASEDFAAAVGAGIGETVYSDITESFRMRVPWLLINLLLAMVVAFVIETQTGIISSEPVLAALMPLVALLGGNGGNQSLAVMIRSLATDDVPGSQVRAILQRQVGIGLLTGATLAIAAGTLTYLLLATPIFDRTNEPIEVALVVGLAMMANMVIGSVAGSGIPLLLRKLRLDPALAASIFLTLITDMVGFGGFLLIAALMLG